MSIIVIEGLDGSGKGTQYKLLVESLKQMGKEVCEVDFPDYNSNSSALVKMYLGGEFGKDPKDVNPYAACSFYAVDRVASYLKNWKKDYDAEKIIIANRYISSNIVYQMSKVKDENWDEFIDWVCDLECEKFGLPQADLVIYLDVPVEISQKLMTGRYKGDENKKDIHESDINFLKECRKSAMFAAKKLSWEVLTCVENGKIKSIETISNEILEIVKGKKL